MDRKNDFVVQYTKIENKDNSDTFTTQILDYKSKDGTCTDAKKFSEQTPQFNACVEAVDAIYDSDVVNQNITRETYGCGNFVKQLIVTPTGAVTEGGNENYFDTSAAASEVKVEPVDTEGQVIALSTIVGILGFVLIGIVAFWFVNRTTKPKFSAIPTGRGNGEATASKAATSKKPVVTK